MTNSFRQLPLAAELFDGATVVLGQLPKSLDALREIAELAATNAEPEVQLFFGGRVKHMTRAMNGALSESFGEVRASLATQKSRVLLAWQPRSDQGPSVFPMRAHHADLDLWVCAYGAAFAGTKLDLGTRLLLESVDRMHPSARSAVDLGCGTGVIAAVLARASPTLSVLATDE